jgi:CP family cyanate transporter-like MFS transporter
VRRKYLVEGIIFFSYLMFSMSWVGASSFMHEIMKHVNIHSLTQASSLSTAVTIAKIVGTAIAAWIAGKLGLRYAVLLASALISFGILTPLTTNFTLLVGSRFLMGLGGALMIVYFNPIVVGWFSPGERPAVNGLNNITFNLGAVLVTFLLAPAVRLLGSWDVVLVCISIATILLCFLWLLFGKAGPLEVEQGHTAIANYRFRDGLRDRFTWNLAVVYSGMLSFYIVMFTFYPAAGIHEVQQGVLLSGLVGGVAGMVVAKRVRNRVGLLRLCGALQLASACLVSFSNTHWIVLASSIALGIFLILPLATLFTLGQDQPGSTRAVVSVRFSIFWSVSYVIATAATTVFAALVDANHGSFNIAICFICAMQSLFFIGSIFLKDGRRTATPHKREPSANLAEQGS